MVSCKILFWRPLLSWQPTVFIQIRNWLQAHKSVKRWNAAARLYSVAVGQIYLVLQNVFLVQNISTKCGSWLNIFLLVVTMVKNMVHWWQIPEILQLQPQKRAKLEINRIYMSVGIVGLSHVRARRCTSTPSLQNGWPFRSLDAWFHVSMLLSADTINIFS